MEWQLLFVVETLAAPSEGLAVRLADCGYRVRRANGLCEAKRLLNQRAASLVAIHATTSAARLRALCTAPGLREMPLVERESYRVGAVEIDAGSHRAQRGGRSLDLTPTEFRLLLALARRGGEVVPHSELIEEVWRGGSDDGHENLRLYVRYLRRKLGDDPKGPRLVLSHRGQGYALAQGVRMVEDEGVGHG